jgi:hypothetical protein
MDDESYSFTIDKSGENIVKFIPTNGGVEKNYPFNVLGVSNNIESKPTVTPVVV